MSKSFSFNGCKAGDVISRMNGNFFEKATIIIPTELGVIRNGTTDKHYICFETYKQLKKKGWTFEGVEERTIEPQIHVLEDAVAGWGIGFGTTNPYDEQFVALSKEKAFEIKEKLEQYLKEFEIRKILKG